MAVGSNLNEGCKKVPKIRAKGFPFRPK